jgi:hypothetical protein
VFELPPLSLPQALSKARAKATVRSLV